MPDGSITKPEPREFELRGREGELSPPGLPGPPPWPRRLKNSSKRSSKGVPGGNCGRVRLRASTVVDAEMLTTAPVTSSARSAKDSGAERAWAAIGTDVLRSVTTAKQEAANRSRDGRAESRVDAGAFIVWSIDDLSWRTLNLGRLYRHSSADCGGSGAKHQPKCRMPHTIATPTTAEMMPTTLIRSLGLCAASYIARRIPSGK